MDNIYNKMLNKLDEVLLYEEYLSILASLDKKS